MTALKPGSRIVLSGYYGFDNFGDELILEALTQALKARGYRPTVLSAQPKLTRHRLKVAAINRKSPSAILWHLSRADAFISGGGGLFQDATGPASPLYYGGLILLASWMGLPVAHLFQSVGPLKTGLGRWMTKKALQACHWVCVRDEQSAGLVQELTGQKPMVGADALWLKPPSASAKVKNPEIWTIGLSLRPHPRLTQVGLDTLAKCMALLIAGSRKPVVCSLLSCQPDMDTELLQRFQSGLELQLKSLQAEGAAMVPVSFTLSESVEVIEQTIEQCDLLFGMRFHALLSALIGEVPVFGLSYDPKVTALLRSIPLDSYPVEQLDHLTVEHIHHYFAHYPHDLKQWANQQRQQAQIALNALEALVLQPNSSIRV